MVDLISWPPRLDPTGRFVARDDGSEQYHAEELAQLVTTEPGERELVPTYGLTDPAFGGFGAAAAAALDAQVLAFGPPVVVRRVSGTWNSSGTRQDVVVEFDERPADLGADTYGGASLADA